jgi:hypothetical protein
VPHHVTPCSGVAHGSEWLIVLENVIAHFHVTRLYIFLFPISQLLYPLLVPYKFSLSRDTEAMPSNAGHDGHLQSLMYRFRCLSIYPSCTVRWIEHRLRIPYGT